MKTQWLEYTIYLSDKALVEQLQAAASRGNSPINDPAGDLVNFPSGGGLIFFPNGLLFASPDRAAVEFGATIVDNFAHLEAVSTGQRPGNPPYIFSPWIFPVGYDPDLRQHTAQDRFTEAAGYMVGAGPLGDDVRYIWVGRYEYAPSTTATDGEGTPVGTPENIQQVRWADGFELPGHGEGQAGGEGTLGVYVTPDASRFPGGLGLRVCDPGGFTKIHTVDEFRTGLTPTKSWERIYLRLNTLPPVPFPFMRFHTSGGANNSATLAILPSGALAIEDVNGSNVRSLLASTSAKALNVWMRLDILLDTTAGSVRLYVNGVEEITVAGTAGFGIGGTHTRSILGNPFTLSGTDRVLCFDVDDWRNADHPTNVADSSTHGLDWLNGTHVVKLRPSAYGPAHSAGDWGASALVEWLASRMIEPITDAHVSNTAGSVLEVDIEVGPITGLPRSINGGITALTVGMRNRVGNTGGNGTLSISRNGGAYADTALVQVTTANWDSAAHFPAGLAEPEALSSLRVKYTAGSGAVQRIVEGIGVAAESLGVFGPEDFPPESALTGLVPPPGPAGTHNYAYGPLTPWAFRGPAPVSRVMVIAGTYVGTGTKVELTFPNLVSWIHVRRVSPGTVVNGPKWWSSMTGAKVGWEQPLTPEGFIKQQFQPPASGGDGGFEVVLTIAGDDGSHNESGATYQYVAFCDPGQRFCLAGHFTHHRGTTDRTTQLFKPTFLPEAAFLTRVSHGGAITVASYFKGRGHATQSISLLNAAETANALEFQTGAMVIRSAIMAGVGSLGDQEYPFIAFRRDDGSGDPGIVDTLAILSYVGNGAASRTISLPTLTKRPLFALVVPHNTAAFFRDPSHTGTTSSQISTGETLSANASTGITGGGVGTLDVGSALNSNGVTYEVFVILGCETAGNNGWGPADCVSEPVAPLAPADWPSDIEDLPEDEDDFPEFEGEGGGGGGSGAGPGEPGGVDFGAQCLAASQKVCQQALGYIGITELLDDVSTDTSPAATMCRLHYEDCVNEALREFPWDFATKYATLTHIAGSHETPVNGDWAYSFELPDDCIFPRRLVDPRIGRKFDPDPPPFRQGEANASDQRLLYTNFRDPETDDDDPAVELEYTFRPGCAAGQGDSLFRQALTWLLAHKLAPGLSRNKVTAADCWAMFLHTVNRAQTVNARAQQHEDPNGDPDWIRGRN